MTKYNPEKPISISNLPKPWTVKQFLFAEAYLGKANRNASEASRLAGYEKETAYSSGSRMLRNVEFIHIQDYIREQLGGLLQEFDMSKEALLQRLGSIVHTELTDIVQLEDGKLTIKDTKDIPEGALGALKSITSKKGMTNEISVTLHDVKGAIQEASKLQKLYEELGTTINAQKVQVYLPDNGRDDPAHRERRAKLDEEADDNE